VRAWKSQKAHTFFCFLLHVGWFRDRSFSLPCERTSFKQHASMYTYNHTCLPVPTQARPCSESGFASMIASLLPVDSFRFLFFLLTVLTWAWKNTNSSGLISKIFARIHRGVIADGRNILADKHERRMVSIHRTDPKEGGALLKGKSKNGKESLQKSSG